MKAILHLTKNCNLRCKYCYAPDKVTDSMSVDTAKKAVDLVAKLGKDSFCVSYFGGEPLLEWDKLVEITEYSKAVEKKVKKSAHFRLSTNAVLFTEDKLKYCRDNKILYAVSLDGNRKAHNAQRITSDGSGSFDLVDRQIDKMLEYNPITHFTCVITPQTAALQYESMKFMWDRGVRYIVHQLDYSHPDWKPEHMEILEREYSKISELYLEKMRAGEHFYMVLIDNKLRTHTLSPVKLGKLCSLGKNKISVAADGSIYPCVQFVSDNPDTENYKIGHVDTGLTPRRNELINANLEERKQCIGCKYIDRCANYCGCLNWQTTGKITEVSGIVCAHEKVIIPIADRVGNILWEEKTRPS